MLTQLFPSSTVATGVRLKIGLGTVASEIPGGTCQPEAANSGGVREPSQYCLMKFGLPPTLPEPVTAEPPGVSTESDEASVNVELWLVGPVSPRTPMSQKLRATQAPVVVWFGASGPSVPVNDELYSLTMFCWSSVPAPAPPTPIWYELFCQKMLFSSFGVEIDLQFGWPVGQVTATAARFAERTALCWITTNPPGCGHAAAVPFMQLDPCVLAIGPPSVVKSTPEDAVLVLETIVLLTMFTSTESTSEIPAPSQPATLSAMMLLVTVTVFHCEGCLGKETRSEPLTAWKAMPPPLPASAALPMMRLALITNPGPTPSLGPTPEIKVDCGLPVPLAGLYGTQSWSMAALPLQTMSASGVPMTMIPPPLAGIVGLRLWLNRIELCSISPS